jgi:acetyltransferase-like isoleucine patch superfamily enzyme
MSYLINGIKNRWRRFKKSIGNFYFKTLLNKSHYIHISNSQLIINWVYQRIFRFQSYIPNSVHFTTKIQGYHNIVFTGNPESVLISMAVSGGCYFTIFKNTTLTIGENTIWACNVCIQTGNHDFIDREKYILKNIVIGKNCWIGNSATILPGVELGDNVTIGANSVVTKSFPSNCVIAGVPAKIIRQL